MVLIPDICLDFLIGGLCLSSRVIQLIQVQVDLYDFIWFLLGQKNNRLDVRTNSNYIPTKLRISGQYFYSTNTVRAAFSHKIMDGINFAPY